MTSKFVRLRPPPQPSPASQGKEPVASPACGAGLGWGRAVLGLAFVCTTARAQSPAPEGPSLLPLVLTLVFVLALIPVAVWMLKRLGAGNVAGTAGMRVVAQLPLGQRERLVVVEAGDRWLLLGVTSSSINRVGTLPKGELPALPPTAVSFAALLARARKGGGNG